MLSRIVGFDIRIDRGEQPIWDPERRAGFLLRDDVEVPFSVDSQVWPSIFSAFPEWHGVLDLWEDLDVMRAAANASGGHGCLIAVGIVWGFLSHQEQTEWATQKLVATRPMTLGAEWVLLGYDVADAWLTSGLSNCGYTPAERLLWTSKWAGALNENHLLGDPNDAGRFACETNQRVPEHAPFHAFALHRLAS